MPLPYNPRDWYWFVGGDTTRVFSSLIGDYVVLSTPAYVTWLGFGNTPTNTPDEATLGDTLSPFLIRPIAPGVLDGYQGTLASIGIKHPLYKIIFQMYNDIRVLKGQQPITPAQALAALKGLQ